MVKVKVFRCRICGDPYIGSGPPTQCPFCGAQQQYFVKAVNWNADEFNITLSDVARQDLQAALQLEMDNAAFYDCAKNVAKNSGDAYSFAKFKALMKVEYEHASAIVKFLRIPIPELKRTACGANAKANTKEGWERENRAIKSYAKFRDRVSNSRLKEFFSALVEIETDHLDLHAENLP